MPDLVPLPGSERGELQGVTQGAPLDTSQVITVTVLLRRRADIPRALVEGQQTISTGELGEQYGADSDDAHLVAEVLGGYGLTVTETHLDSRRLKVSGTIAAMETAFGTSLAAVSSPHPDGTGDVQHRYRTGGLSVPARLDGIVTAVLGLDDRPQARAQFRRPPTTRPRAAAEPEDDGTSDPAPKPKPQGTPLTAPQVASFYQFPPGTDGTGQTVAIIELGGGYQQSDLSTYFSGLGLAVPSVTAVGVGGASNSPGDPADGEVELDIEVVGGVAPGAAQKVYFADNTD